MDVTGFTLHHQMWQPGNPQIPELNWRFKMGKSSNNDGFSIAIDYRTVAVYLATPNKCRKMTCNPENVVNYTSSFVGVTLSYTKQHIEPLPMTDRACHEHHSPSKNVRSCLPPAPHTYTYTHTRIYIYMHTIQDCKFVGVYIIS